MQQMHEPPPAVPEKPSRRRPLRRRASVSIPIPEPAQPEPKPRRIQDVLSAHEQAIEARLEQGLRDFRVQAAEEIRRLGTQLRAESARVAGGPSRTGAIAANDALRGILTHAEERFQAITLRLQRMEGALRLLARSQREATAASDGRHIQSLLQRTEALSEAVGAMSAEQQRLLHGIGASVGQALSRLADEQASRLDDLAPRIGRGVVAVARRLERDLTRRILEATSDGASRKP